MIREEIEVCVSYVVSSSGEACKVTYTLGRNCKRGGLARTRRPPVLTPGQLSYPSWDGAVGGI